MHLLLATPQLDLDDLQALDGIHALRRDVAIHLRAPRRWEGGLRRSAQARATRGSNSIGG